MGYRGTLAVLFLLLIAAPAPAQNFDAIETNLTASEMADVLEFVSHPAINIQSITYQGSPDASGTYTAPASTSVIGGGGPGLILTSGWAIDADPTWPGALPDPDRDNGLPGDPRLDALTFAFPAGSSSAPTQDASVLEITFSSLVEGVISFEYAFASEEYTYLDPYVPGFEPYEDVAAIFQDDTLVLYDPDLEPWLVHPGHLGEPWIIFPTSATYPNYYGMVIGMFDVEIDIDVGTTTLTIAIADAEDGNIDSALFVCGGIFTPDAIDFVRADTNADGLLNIADAIASLESLFGSAPLPCENAGDANDDENADIADPIFILAALFSSGPAPDSPFPVCGPDPTFGGLSCDTFDGCGGP